MPVRTKLLLALLVAAFAVVFVSASTAQQGRLVLTVGLNQDLDSPNVTVGFLVSDYELWNLQYATLTDKAADDFETIPGLAESWEGSRTASLGRTPSVPTCGRMESLLDR